MVHQGRPTRRLVAVTAALALTLGACSDDSSDEAEASTTTTSSAPTTSTTAAPTTTSTTLSEEDATIAAAFDAYVHATETFIEIAANPDPADPRIAQTSTGEMLQVRIQDLGTMQAAGERIAYPEDSVFRMELMEGSGEVRDEQTVVLTACIADDSWEQVVATGQPTSGNVKSLEATVAMLFEDGTWKLAEQVFANRVAGVAGCAAGWE